MASSRRNRKPPRNRQTGFTWIEIIFVLSVFACTLLTGLWISGHIETTLEDPRWMARPLPDDIEEPVEPSEFEFDMKKFLENKTLLINRALHEKETLENNHIIHNIKMTRLHHEQLFSVYEKYWDKWVPDPTRFEGVEEFLIASKFNGTIAEEYFYLDAPSFHKTEDGRMIIGYNTGTDGILRSLKVENCRYMTNSDCHDSEMELKDGDLYMREVMTGKTKEWRFTRVYYVPSSEFLD
ncbi:hypothetical protein CRE_21152 [Caenorhabditis remanei]|uniref:Uncharacterized protein n=1 Tax=Caenorhabditis remanei TaxID=31234 RepID=E3MF04_CAERE|nr:hypothetical protein CRE_21152 [Caenorhabditis remanei]